MFLLIKHISERTFFYAYSFVMVILEENMLGEFSFLSLRDGQHNDAWFY